MTDTAMTPERLDELERRIKTIVVIDAYTGHDWTDEIEALIAKVRALQARERALTEALEPFAKLADIFDKPRGTQPTSGEIHAWETADTGYLALTCEQLRTARDIITPKG